MNRCTVLLAISLAVIFAVCTSSFVDAQALVPKESDNKAAPSAGGTQAKYFTDLVTGMQFVLVKGGCYQMGNVANNAAKPIHEVCVSDFYIGKNEVTQRQWDKIMGGKPSRFKQCGHECPVENVSWDMVQEYIKNLNSESGKHFRLPTEAEWEYAARSGGRNEKWAGTSNEASLGQYAWYVGNSDQTTHKAGLKKPNGLGLNDMSGNVWEWCQDWYDAAYYAKSPKDNPTGPEKGETRVMRGGSWASNPGGAQVTGRANLDPDRWDRFIGFRLVLPAR